jgi:hypothetical protein
MGLSHRVMFRQWVLEPVVGEVGHPLVELASVLAVHVVEFGQVAASLALAREGRLAGLVQDDEPRHGSIGFNEAIVQGAADAAMQSPGESGSLLWHAVYGVKPGYDIADDCAIESVKSVVLPVVKPNEGTATLDKPSDA